MNGISADFVRLGCAGCGYAKAKSTCSALDGYHMCELLELHTGGYQVARNMGWVFAHLFKIYLILIILF